MKKGIFQIVSLSFIVITCLSNALSQEVEIRGVYGSPESLWRKGFNLQECGVNALFVHSGAIDQELMQRAKKEGVKVFAEFATLNGKNYVENHPEAWPINEKGEQAPPASWFMGVCPTDSDFKKYRLSQLFELLQKYEIAGVWMDYLHWHAQFEEPNPILPETCFNESCLNAFQVSSGIKVPQGTPAERAQWILTHHNREWRDWRCSVLVGWANDIKTILKKERPDAILGNYQCPWKDDEFNGARRRILGLDFDMLSSVVDVYSPMVYHGRIGRNPEWVKDYVQWFCGRMHIKKGSFPKVWSIVQAHNDPAAISAKEFEQVLRFGVSGEANGVMMFTVTSVAEDENKIEVMKKVYQEWMKK